MIKVAEKILSKNDLGITGSHQAGFLIPKDLAKSGFFPFLNPMEKNPRIKIPFMFEDKKYFFSYIHYNTKPLGLGTRDEFRITGLSKFYRESNCLEGDILRFEIDTFSQSYRLSVVHKIEMNYKTHEDLISKTLVIHAGWTY